jgi:glucokinase
MEKTLVADIGGTKTVLALVTHQENAVKLDSLRRYSSRRHRSFEDMLDEYLSHISPVEISSLCVAVAGVVVDNRCRLSNLSMEIDGESLRRQKGFKQVFLINDLAASGYGLDVIPPGSADTIHQGTSEPGGNQVLISPGTGLGESIIHAVGGKYIPVASEGGHADFAPFDGRTERLWAFLKRKQNRVAVEDCLSGPGIYNIFQFLLVENGVELEDARRQELANEPGVKISSWAIDGGDRLALETISLFLDILAAEAGNMALKAWSTGGAYIGGGIIPALLSLVDSQRFASVFSAKGIHQPLLERIPIYAITDTDLPLYGAARYISTLDTA